MGRVVQVRRAGTRRRLMSGAKSIRQGAEPIGGAKYNTAVLHGPCHPLQRPHRDGPGRPPFLPHRHPLQTQLTRSSSRSDDRRVVMLRMRRRQPALNVLPAQDRLVLGRTVRRYACGKRGDDSVVVGAEEHRDRVPFFAGAVDSPVDGGNEGIVWGRTSAKGRSRRRNGPHSSNA